MVRINNYKMNFILIGLLSGVMWRYPIADKMYYLFLLGLIILLGVKFVIDRELRIPIKTWFLCGICLLVFTSMVLLSIDGLEFILKRYLVIFILIIYMYLSFLKYGYNYAEKFYRQLTIVLNVLSVLNLYQIIFRKPILLNYMELAEVGYNYHFGTAAYRTMSIFHHPIIAGLFFVIALLCNMYVLKTPFKYVLQLLLLLNIYTTSSRSAWLAVVLIFIVYGFIHHRKVLLQIIRPKLSYLKLFIMTVFAGVGFLFLLLNFQEISSSIVDRFGDSLSSDSTDGSNLQRTMTISLIFHHMINSSGLDLLFGHGAGTVSQFMLKNPLLIKDFGTTDNQYLSWFFEFGLVGIAFYFSVLVFIAVRYFKNKKKHWTIELSFLSFIVVTFELIFFDAAGWPVVIIMLAFLIGILTFNFKPRYNTN